MLRFKLFKGAALLVIAFGVLSGVLGMHLIKSRVVHEAQNSVRLDLSSAWSVYNQRLHETRIILRLLAAEKELLQGFERAAWDDDTFRAGIQRRLEGHRHSFGLDFMTLTDPDGRVLMRTASPYTVGDYVPHCCVIRGALEHGEPRSGTVLLPQSVLEAEARGLGERAFLPLENTPKARPTPRTVEDRGMVMMSAVPVMQGGRVLGILYGGVLLNRNADIVDRISDVVYRGDTYEGAPRGTVTIFLHDSRVATTVRNASGNRAYGSRVSKEVADRVLDNGSEWVDRAFVVKDWYLTAYEPIRNCEGEIVGMLYVGTLEKPFRDLGKNVLLRYALLSGIGIIAALISAFVFAGRIASPLHRLASAARQMRGGNYPDPVAEDGASCQETRGLIRAFNRMLAALDQRETELKEANKSLAAANAAYMETVEFVSHELKQPVSSMTNYVYLLKEQLMGPLTDKQAKAVGVLDSGLRSVSEMIRHYLNLARIENNEMMPVRTRVLFLEDVIAPVLDAHDLEFTERELLVDYDIPKKLELDVDVNMIREVFENLVSNAVKYGREKGTISIAAKVVADMLHCSVRNDGDGIPEAKMALLFRKFSRLHDEPSAAKAKGTGLGLFITRRIIEEHGGHIDADSEPGKWAEFRLTLPIWLEKDE